MTEGKGVIPNKILDVLKHYGISYPEEMDNPQICCLFHHDPKPSLTFYPETNSFYCFGCHATGTVETLVMKLENCTYKQALQLIHGDGYEWSRLRAKAEKQVDIDFNLMYEILAKHIRNKVRASVDNQEKLDKLRGLILKYTRETINPDKLYVCLNEIRSL